MSDDEDVIMEGYMMKKGDVGPVKKWKKRYFIFKQDGHISYYPDNQDVFREKGHIDLNKATAVRKTQAAELPEQFEIEVPGRVFLLQPPDKRKRLAWMEAIENYMAAKNGRGSSNSTGSAKEVISLRQQLALKDEQLAAKDAQIASLEKRLASMRDGGSHSSSKSAAEMDHVSEAKIDALEATVSSLRHEVESKREQIEQLERQARTPNTSSGKEAEIKKLKADLQEVLQDQVRMENSLTEEIEDLKEAYFKACAIGIVQQRKLRRDDLPPIAELRRKCVARGTPWSGYVDWLKKDLPNK
mmetsp:Transcript_2193/g.5187  ORF Transcript_2193/g.5187 Transcript_2193/m.5187 type:complete len:300 (+) Transcript_2193:198-1097(+)|eukprot:CAMPEP_0177652722 /NCGR_PEP_ID=MMETSP0447-20121125/13295_1 /TAXON_ID=0 /ORGANISM="Stygamoeba regulata, Strain BSH-02190019" /LENGTH=299 /DNA_ID=CAMNT_0019156013 /DNA_START=182 /DNA_END=1081 /DNA_ORIENTATION=+